jgi:hypothetical protein
VDEVPEFTVRVDGVPVAPGVDDVTEFTGPVEGMPVVSTEDPVDPAPILTVLLVVDAVPVFDWVPVLVVTVPGVLLPGMLRTTRGNSPGRSFRTSPEHGAEASADSVVEMQWRSARLASAPDGLGLEMVWATAEPASRSAASRASETGEDLFMAHSFSERCGGLKSAPNGKV